MKNIVIVILSLLFLVIFVGQSYAQTLGTQMRRTPTLTPTIALIAPSKPALTPAPTPKTTVIVVPGYGSNLTPDSYSFVIDTLLIHGYTVLKYYPTYTDISNYARLVNVWSQGVGRLAGRKRVIVLGHSVGGAVAVHFCASDPRCIASINMDGGPAQNETIPVPNLYLEGEAGSYCDQECANRRRLADQITGTSYGKIVFIQGLKHMNFTNYALNPPPDLVEHGYFGIINAQTGLNQITNEISIFLSTVH